MTRAGLHVLTDKRREAARFFEMPSLASLKATRTCARSAHALKSSKMMFLEHRAAFGKQEIKNRGPTAVSDTGETAFLNEKRWARRVGLTVAEVCLTK